jgi:hypothetical protein
MDMEPFPHIHAVLGPTDLLVVAGLNSVNLVYFVLRIFGSDFETDSRVLIDAQHYF